MKNTPRNLQTDNGKEFYNKEFKDLMQKLRNNPYSTFSNLKASIIERVNRTLKNLMWKQFSFQGSYNWLDLLPKIVNHYNNIVHSNTNLKSKDVNKKNAKEIIVYNYTRQTIFMTSKKIKVKNRIPYVLASSEKSFRMGIRRTGRMKFMIFAKKRIRIPQLTFYKIKNGHEIPGAFYTEELQNTLHPDVFLVEKIVWKRGNKWLVKWLGLDNRHNSWINKNDLV